MTYSTTAIECTRDVADALMDVLKKLADGQVARADKNNLDGGLQTVLLVAQTVTPIIAALVPLLVAHVESSRIARLKFRKPDGTEIEIINPTREQLEKYLDK